MGKKVVKAKSKEGNATKKGRIVNLHENSDHSELEDVPEVDQEKEKIPREKTNEPVQKKTQKQTQ